MHPLTPDLSTLSDEDLAKQVNDLGKRLNQAYNFGNAQLVQQVQMMLEDYQEEHSKRQRKMMDDLAKRAGRDFDDIIDIS